MLRTMRPFAIVCAILIALIDDPSASRNQDRAALFTPSHIEHLVGLNFTRAMATADVNHDGVADLVATTCVTDHDCGAVTVMLGAGDGAFHHGLLFATGGRSASALALADINGDNAVDLVVGHAPPEGDLSLLLGAGDGTFQPPADTSVLSPGSPPRAIAFVTAEDVNNDGHADLVVGREGTASAVEVLLGGGDGTFRGTALGGLGDQQNRAVAVADMNQDGVRDLIVAQSSGKSQAAADRIAVLLGRGDGSFRSPRWYASGAHHVRAVLVGDLDRDGRPDVIAAHAERNTIGVLRGRHGGVLEPASRVAVPGTEDAPNAAAGAVVLADADGDGLPDLIVGTCALAKCDGAVYLLSGRGDGHFEPGVRYSAAGFGAGLVNAADLNQDLRPDVMIASCTDWRCDASSIGVLLGTDTPASLAADENPGSRANQAEGHAADVIPTLTPAVSTPGAGAYNVKVVSDASPDLTDLNSFMRSTTSAWATNREKVWALFYWSHILKRQTPPMVLHGFEVTDPIRNFADYGFTMCSTNSGINQSLYELLGLRHQYWDICNHTVSTVEYDGLFQMIDTAMSNLVTTDDGSRLATIQEAAANGARLVRERSLYSTSPNGFLTGSDTIRSLPDYVSPAGSTGSGYARNFCETGLKYRDYYYNWNRGHRYVLNLRENESYTRYYRRLGSTPDYWVGSEKVSAPDPAVTFEIDAVNRFGIRGNGAWSFVPSLAASSYMRDAYSATNIAAAASGGLRPAASGRAGELVYKVQGANAIASQTLTAQFLRTDAQAAATVAVSTNHGATWTQLATLSATLGTPTLAATMRNQVNGAYETLLRVTMVPGTAADGLVLKTLRIDTVTHLNTKALPRLHVGRNQMLVDVGEQTDTMVLWPDLRGDLWKKDVYSYSNIATQGVSVPRKYTAVAYPASLTQDAHLTYRLQAPSDITRLVYGGRLHNYSAGSFIDFLHSFDNGATWVRSYRFTDVARPYDDIHYETVTGIPPGVRTVLFRFLMHNTNTSATRATGLYAVRMEAAYRPVTAAPRPIDVTMRWKEVRADRTLVERSHRQRATSFPFTYVINVGGADHPVMESIKVSVENAADTTPFGYNDGIDSGGQKYIPVFQRDGSNLALRRPYTFSRTPSQFQESAGATDTAILTDGIVGAPATGGITYWWGQCWTSGSVVDLRVDLGSVRSVGVFRAHLYGYPGWDALKGQVQDTVEVLTSTDGSTFVSRGFLSTSLWRKDIPANYMLQDDERATGWNFARRLSSPASARYVRYRVTPKRNLCVSELQVLDTVETRPFDLRIALPAAAPTITVPNVVGLTQAAATSAIVAAGLNVGTVATSSSTTVAAGLVISQAPAAGSAVAGGSGVSLVVSSGPPSTATVEEVVVYVAASASIVGGWSPVDDSSAAGNARLQNTDLGAAKLTAPLADPTRAFDISFNATAGTGYRLWLRGRAQNDRYYNDSVYVQFDGSVTSSGAATWRMGTTSATPVVLEDCSGCGLQGWGWADNGYGVNVMGPLVYFAQTGPQRMRIQVREDGVGIDQVVLSAKAFLNTRPGATKNDTTIVPRP